MPFTVSDVGLFLLQFVLPLALLIVSTYFWRVSVKGLSRWRYWISGCGLVMAAASISLYYGLFTYGFFDGNLGRSVTDDIIGSGLLLTAVSFGCAITARGTARMSLVVTAVVSSLWWVLGVGPVFL